MPDAASGGGKRYWRARIANMRGRYLDWCKRVEPRGASRDDWLAWQDWKLARLNYFKEERDKLYGTKRTSYVCYLNGLARDHRTHRSGA